MPSLRTLVLTALALGGMAACEGYVVGSATLTIANLTDDSKSQVLRVVADYLRQEGFEDLGRYDAMINLVRGEQPTNDPAEHAKRDELARLYRERTFLNDRSHLSIVWADYTRGVPDRGSVSYPPPTGPFIEMTIYEERPGGFSPEGLRFYERFLRALRDKYGAAVTVEKPPPPTNESEYRRITRVNNLGTMFWLTLIVAIPLLVVGAAANYLLRKTSLPRIVQQIVFVGVTTWLIAPLPFQAAFIMVLPLPNLVAFPWTNLDYYRHVAPFAAVSFPCTLVLCAFVSAFLFRNRRVKSLTDPAAQ